MAEPCFPNFMQMTPRVPRWSWDTLRGVSLVAAIALCVALFAWPRVALFAWWGVVIPLLPLVFFVAPGLWRNVCPLATSNQVPRRLGIQRPRSLPPFARKYGFLVSVVLFLGLVPARKVLFNTNGAALGVLLLAMGALAFVGGVLFKGKSGWCSSFCPLLPVQRVYGQTPFVMVRNSHCEPCVGCAANCYDFNPHVAQLADLYDDDPYRGAYRKLFAGAFPALVLAFYTTNPASGWGIVGMYGRFGVFFLGGIGTFYVLDSVLRVSTAAVATVFGAGALDIYYWFNWPFLARRIAHASPWWFVWPARGIVLGLSLLWIVRTMRKERSFVEETEGASPVRLGAGAEEVLEEAAVAGRPVVTILPDERRIAVVPGSTLLELVEMHGLPIEAGCRMGMCGSDPICVVAGAGNLSAIGDDERMTLERLGLAENTRMACSARVAGPVSILLETQPAEQALAVVGENIADQSIQRVVVIGNGIAGVTAADHARRGHPTCEIDVISRERHHLYNRMAITRLIYGRSAMRNLYLMQEGWYDAKHITTWLNTQVVAIDREQRRVVLGTGESLPYDRLILTAGSSNFVPDIEGFGEPGTFALREAEDAMRIRAFVQERSARQAVVAGGGLLGLEAAHALKKFGLHVTVLEIGERLLQRQLDERGSHFLLKFLGGLGLDVLFNAQTASVQGNCVTLADGRKIDADLFLVCAGISPNVEIARAAGLKVNQGVVVDDHMRTSDPNIFAAGDAAEVGGQVLGIWPAAVEQGRVAAANALGGDYRYEPTPPVTMLKVSGADLTSIGRFEAEGDDDLVVAHEDVVESRYRKLVISDGKIVGAILLGHSLEASGIMSAVKNGTDVIPWLERLQAGDWSVFLEEAPGAHAAAVA
jgi:nitrite reductase (NADH) large subunit